MKKTILTLLALVGILLTASAQSEAYAILSQRDTTVKAQISDISLGSRAVRHYIYEYPSTDFDGQPVTISGVILVPSNVADGSAPCDGIILYNNYTLSSPSLAPSQGGLDIPSDLLACPLKPNYIIVASDYIGYGSSIDHPVAYLCGDTNARNSLDGLLAARQLLDDEQIPQGKYLFNMGYSQGGTESMFVAKLRDMEYKDKGITFNKTFSGGGILDYGELYAAYVRANKCDDINDVVLMVTSVIENCHLDIDYHDIFLEPAASSAKEYYESKDKAVADAAGISDLKELTQLFQPAYLNLNSPEAKVLIDKFQEISIANGWEPDLTQNYYIEHCRHDNFVPVQSSRPFLMFMREKGFTTSLVPGKTSLQTNMLVFKLTHQQAAAVWFIQALAAMQFWPVVYYEGEQNRYYHAVVHDLNLMKFVKYLESWGIDLRTLFADSNSGARELRDDIQEGIDDGSLNPDDGVSVLYAANKASFFDILDKLDGYLAKVDLTVTDALEMLDDSGITLVDILEVYTYLTTPPTEEEESPVFNLTEDVEAPIYLLRLYERTLANWLLLGGIDVNYDQWGW